MWFGLFTLLLSGCRGVDSLVTEQSAKTNSGFALVVSTHERCGSCFQNSELFAFDLTKPQKPRRMSSAKLQDAAGKQFLSFEMDVDAEGNLFAGGGYPDNPNEPFLASHQALLFFPASSSSWFSSLSATDLKVYGMAVDGPSRRVIVTNWDGLTILHYDSTLGEIVAVRGPLLPLPDWGIWGEHLTVAPDGERLFLLNHDLYQITIGDDDSLGPIKRLSSMGLQAYSEQVTFDAYHTRWIVNTIVAPTDTRFIHGELRLVSGNSSDYVTLYAADRNSNSVLEGQLIQRGERYVALEHGFRGDQPTCFLHVFALRNAGTAHLQSGGFACNSVPMALDPSGRFAYVGLKEGLATFNVESAEDLAEPPLLVPWPDETEREIFAMTVVPHR